MANFEEAYEKTSVFEGGYVHDEDDSGGETYRGIARNFWPKWGGWVIIDTYKKSSDFPKKWVEITRLLAKDKQLNQFVEEFYKTNFWDEVRGDDIVDQGVTNNIYDFAVNSGVSRASRYAQRIVGAVEDGYIGNKSIKAINTYDPDEFIKKFKDAREAFYRRIVANDPSQEKFLDGWLKRAKEA